MNPWPAIKDFFIGVFSSIGTWVAGYIYGRLKQKNKKLEQDKASLEDQLEAVDETKNIHNRIDTDPAYRQSVRDKFKNG